MATPELGHSRRDLVGHRKSVVSLSWSHTGRKLASGSNDESVRTWNVEANPSAKAERCDLALTGLGGIVQAVEWHPKRDDQLGVLTDKQLRWARRADGHGPWLRAEHGPLVFVFAHRRDQLSTCPNLPRPRRQAV